MFVLRVLPTKTVGESVSTPLMKPDEYCKRLPVPRMEAASARADVGGVGFRNFERRSQSRDWHPCEPRVNLCEIDVFGEPSWFGCRAPCQLRGSVLPLSSGALALGFRTLRDYPADFRRLNQLSP
jgi:hypothetical protein